VTGAATPSKARAPTDASRSAKIARAPGRWRSQLANAVSGKDPRLSVAGDQHASQQEQSE